MTTVAKYTRELIFALRLRDVPGEVIGDAVAQVESHVADTGEDPVSAFGPAREYAKTFGEPKSPARRWPWYVLNWAIGFLFGCVLLIGVMAQVRGDSTYWGLPPVVLVVVGAIGLVGYLVALTLIWADRVKDPRKTH